jgi:chromosomal replication initiation ATPase DnaA
VVTPQAVQQAILPGLLNNRQNGPWLPVRAAVAAEQALHDEALPVVCLYGPTGVGKSHLLTLATARGVSTWDNLDVLPQAAQPELFHALQQAAQGKGRVAVASIIPVAQLGNLLADVKSRLLLAPQLEIGLPDDAELRALMVHWAKGRQLTLVGAVADYVLSRAARNPAVLHELLMRLDRLSLAEKRKITVPLARRVLEG